MNFLRKIFIGTSTDNMNDWFPYIWNFGDGSTASGYEVKHTYINSGSYILTLTVRDVHGTTATAQTTVEVAIDNDGDSLTDSEEIQKGTNPQNDDTDGDYLIDYWEIYTYATDPTNKDVDNDEAWDWFEVAYIGYNTDHDGDGILSPYDWDSDGDWIKDGIDANPTKYNDVDGTIITYNTITVDNTLGVSVIMDYTPDENIKATITKVTSPPAGIRSALSKYVQIETQSINPFTSQIRFKYLAIPDNFAVYRYDGTNWVIEGDTGTNTDYIYAKVEQLGLFVVADTIGQHSDDDGLDDNYERVTPYTMNEFHFECGLFFVFECQGEEHRYSDGDWLRGIGWEPRSDRFYDFSSQYLYHSWALSVKMKREL